MQDDSTISFKINGKDISGTPILSRYIHKESVIGVRKVFRWEGGARTILMSKKQQKIYFFLKKSNDIPFLAGKDRRGWGGGKSPLAPLRTPMTNIQTMCYQLN
jgi:hypothetical protein